MATTGVIFVDQKVLLKFAEIQHLTNLDANKQVLLLVQLFHCVKSFEVQIKECEVTPEQSVIKDFFHKLYKIISCKQDDVSTTDKPALKTEPLTGDISDSEYPEPTSDLRECGFLDSTKVKDELNTATVSGSSCTVPSQTAFESAKQEHLSDTASKLNDATTDESRNNRDLISSFAISNASKTNATSQDEISDASAGPSADDGKKAKTTNSGIRRSARHTRLPVKLNSAEFVGLEGAAKKSNYSDSVKSPERSVKKSPKQSGSNTIKQSKTKEDEQQNIKATRNNTAAKTESDVITNNSDLSEKSEQSSVKSPKKASGISNARTMLKSSIATRRSVGRPRKCKPLAEQSEITNTDTKISKAELFAEENKDNSVEKHENTETTELQYDCAVCGVKFDEIGKYVDHVTIHPTENHERIRTNERCYKSDRSTQAADVLDCKECGRQLKTKAALVQHQRSHVAKTIHDVSCPTCGKVFLKKKYLKPHLLRHQGEKNVLCESCPARFYDRKGLYIHYNRVHLGKVKHLEKKFCCSYCPFKSYRKRDIDRHTVVHTKTKNYVCDICGARLAHFTSLSIHKRIHSTEKLFKCSICQKEFSQKISLQNHERIHTGERPYKCDQCCRGFQTSSHLSRHKITHSQELLFPCKICDRYFARPFQVKKHIKDCHSDPDSENQTITYEFIKVEADPEDVVLQDQLVCDDNIQYESIVIEYMN